MKLSLGKRSGVLQFIKWHGFSLIAFMSSLCSAWCKYAPCFKERRGVTLSVSNFICFHELAAGCASCLLTFMPVPLLCLRWFTVASQKKHMTVSAMYPHLCAHHASLWGKVFSSSVFCSSGSTFEAKLFLSHVRHGLITVFLLLIPLFWNTQFTELIAEVFFQLRVKAHYAIFLA